MVHVESNVLSQDEVVGKAISGILRGSVPLNALIEWFIAGPPTGQINCVGD